LGWPVKALLFLKGRNWGKLAQQPSHGCEFLGANEATLGKSWVTELEGVQQPDVSVKMEFDLAAWGGSLGWFWPTGDEELGRTRDS